MSTSSTLQYRLASHGMSLVNHSKPHSRTRVTGRVAGGGGRGAAAVSEERVRERGGDNRSNESLHGMRAMKDT